MADQHLSAADLSRALARSAESVCRHYLGSGRKEGHYWLVGDTANNPGRSLFVRLRGPERGKGAAGKWSDAATGEHGDLLDLIRLSCGLGSFREAADEARRFLSLPQPSFPQPATRVRGREIHPRERIEAARRLFARARPIIGTVAETYLRTRAITTFDGVSTLRFHPGCYYRDGSGARLALPALIASVTDDAGRIMGVHRTWLAADGSGKAAVPRPRRAMGALLGHGVRFGFSAGAQAPVIAAGEGIESVLSLRSVMPTMPMIAALSVAHLGAVNLPAGLRRLYIAADADGAGRNGAERLSRRALDAGIEVLALRSAFGDFNDDLRRLGADRLCRHLLPQLAPGDADRFLLRLDR